MPKKGIKRTKQQNISDNSVSNDSQDQNNSRKKSKKKKKCVSTGDHTGVNKNVNKPTDTTQYEQCTDYLNFTSINNNSQLDTYNLSQYSPFPNNMFPMQSQQFCSTPNNGMMTPTMSMPMPMQHVSPPVQPPQSNFQSKPPWVDELFRRMDTFETKLNKINQIDAIVTKLNEKVSRLEKNTEKLDQIERSTQLMSDEFEAQKNSIADFKRDIDKLTKQFKGMDSEFEGKMKETVNELKRDNDKLKEELINVNMNSMRNNLLFYNLPETQDENCENVVTAFCGEMLKIEEPETKIKISESYRLGKAGDNIRPILVKFHSPDIRDLVKKNAKELKGTNFGISEQLPIEIQKRRREKLPLLKQLRDREIKAYFVRDKIYVGGKEYTE